MVENLVKRPGETDADFAADLQQIRMDLQAMGPFTRGLIESHADNLRAQLRKHGTEFGMALALVGAEIAAGELTLAKERT